MFASININPANPDCIQVIQISDLHVYSPEQGSAMGVDSVAGLEAVIDRINAHETADLVIATGDLVHEYDEQVYDILGRMLAGIHFPVFYIPGNHDHTEFMHDPLSRYGIRHARVIDCGRWRFVMLNSVIPGSDGGALADAELQAAAACAETERYVMVCLHHHPVPVGSPWMDAMIVANGEAFMQVIRQSPSIKGVAWGHIHQAFNSSDNGRLLLGCPATCVQVKPNTTVMELDDLPPGYRTFRLYPDGNLDTSVKWVN